MPKGTVREAVGVFYDREKLEDAIDKLQIDGFDRAVLSIVAADPGKRAQLGREGHRLGDDGKGAAVIADTPSHTEAVTGAAGGLGYAGALGAAGLVVASGGTLAVAVAAAVAAGGAAGALGAALGKYFDQRYADRLASQVDKGGLLLWVTVPDAEAEGRAMAILRACGAEDVEAHTLDAAHTGGADSAGAAPR